MNAIRFFLAPVCALALSALCVGCSQMITIPSEVDPAKASEIISTNLKNPDFIIIDVRTQEEYEKTHIPGALNIDFPSTSFKKEIDAFDHNKTYLLYCRSGNRSARAMETMREMGFRNVAHIAGGITAWERASLRTITGPDVGR
jgi:rhodanese-related sulfurtransferase